MKWSVSPPRIVFCLLKVAVQNSFGAGQPLNLTNEYVIERNTTDLVCMSLSLVFWHSSAFLYWWHSSYFSKRHFDFSFTFYIYNNILWNRHSVFASVCKTWGHFILTSLLVGAAVIYLANSYSERMAHCLKKFLQSWSFFRSKKVLISVI